MNTSRVMLIEDNADEESLTRRGLQRAGLEDAVIARDGAAALDTLSNMEHLPGLVLLDLKLPKLDGSEVLRQIRASERMQNLCVVIFTSSSEPRDIARCYGLGCNSYVIKPVVYEKYITTVAQIVEYWLSLNTTSVPGR